MINNAAISSTIEGITPILIVMLVIIFVNAISKFRDRRALKNISIIPEFSMNDLKFYEVVALTDNAISTTDLISLACYYYLNRDKATDDLEKELIRKYGNKEFLSKLKNSYLKIKMKESGPAIIEKILKDSFIKSISIPIYNKLIKDKFYIYNPALVSIILIVVMLVLGFVSYIAVYASTEANAYVYIAFSLLIGGAFFALFPYYFAENLKNITPIRRNILGCKMFLKTTEYHTVKEDQSKFKSFIPYFIAFDMHHDKYVEMIDFCLEN